MRLHVHSCTLLARKCICTCTVTHPHSYIADACNHAHAHECTCTHIYTRIKTCTHIDTSALIFTHTRTPCAATGAAAWGAELVCWRRVLLLHGVWPRGPPHLVGLLQPGQGARSRVLAASVGAFFLMARLAARLAACLRLLQPGQGVHHKCCAGCLCECVPCCTTSVILQASTTWARCTVMGAVLAASMGACMHAHACLATRLAACLRLLQPGQGVQHGCCASCLWVHACMRAHAHACLAARLAAHLRLLQLGQGAWPWLACQSPMRVCMAVTALFGNKLVA